MKILFAASEAAPFAKTGGLADVAGSLPAALARQGFEVTVLLPLYEQIGPEWRRQMTFLRWDMLSLAWRQVYCGVFSLVRDGVTFWFVDNEAYFKRQSIYGYFDDGERFAFFSRAVLELPAKLGWIPDLLHCNDWHTALAVVGLLVQREEEGPLSPVKSVYTIHNIAYQGVFPERFLADVCGLPRFLWHSRMLEHLGAVNLMQGAVYACDGLTTVSPTYAWELQYDFYAHGLAGAIRDNKEKLLGIRNGIDTALYDPARDSGLSACYTSQKPEGKAVCKAHLQRSTGLREDPDVPLIACVSRLAEDKGFGLLLSCLDELMARDVQLVVLGSGDWAYEEAFRSAARRYPGKLAAHLLYSQSLATAIYGGADLFLMPSLCEPCGLAQMIAMRYGTVPIVRKTGGLQDTVSPWDGSHGVGFPFGCANREDLLDAVCRALTLYRTDQAGWRTLRENAMNSDFSWASSAAAYGELYRDLVPAGEGGDA